MRQGQRGEGPRGPWEWLQCSAMRSRFLTGTLGWGSKVEPISQDPPLPTSTAHCSLEEMCAHRPQGGTLAAGAK